MSKVLVDRRTFLNIAAFTTLLRNPAELPKYKIVSRASRAGTGGFPGLFPAQVIRLSSDRVIEPSSGEVNASLVREMLSTGIRHLTGTTNDREAWSHFIEPNDVVGIKVNCSGAPRIHSSPELVAAIIDRVLDAGVPPQNVSVYERFGDQMHLVNFPKFLPAAVNIFAAEGFDQATRGSILGYDPFTYVDVDFFGEDDTRSNLVRLVSEKFTKIINVPTLKEHQAAGVTGALKNIAYGNFSNVARSHRREVTNTYSFIGTLASVEPLRSRTVLNIVDGLRSVWHGGPFVKDSRFVFWPKQILIGTDPVALDRIGIEIIEAKRKQEGAPSIFDRAPERVKDTPGLNPQFNAFIREPGHVEFAGRLGLGNYELAKIKEQVLKV